MKRVALLQFHRDWEVCRDRLQLLHAFNPGVEMYGLFGGESADFESARDVFEDAALVWHLAGHEARWKWYNTDLGVREWYRSVGHRVPFDVLHVVQWDLLLLAPLDELYAPIPAGALGLTGITPIEAIADRWHWTLNEPHRTELVRLSELVVERFRVEPPAHACLGPGYCLPRAFLDEYAAMDVPELCHDELRLPLFARILGFPVADSGFYPRWFDAKEERFFNANGDEIAEARIREELQRPAGRRAFHPFRKVFETAERQPPGAPTPLEVPE